MSSIREGILAISHEPANRPIVRRFFRFAVAVAIVPIIVYVLVSQIARMVTTTKTGLLSPPIVGGLAAVFALNIVMGTFAMLAVNECVSSPPAIATDSEVEEERDNIRDDQVNNAKPKKA